MWLIIKFEWINRNYVIESKRIIAIFWEIKGRWNIEVTKINWIIIIKSKWLVIVRKIKRRWNIKIKRSNYLEL